MIEESDYENDFLLLIQFFKDVINSITETSNVGSKYLKGALTSIIIDLNVLILLRRNQLPNCQVNQQAWSDYVKHVKRSFLLEMFSLTENRIREICQEKNLQPKSLNMTIKTKINLVLQKATDPSMKRLLREVSDKLRGGFIEFPNVLSEVLKIMIKGRGERSEWIKFFEIFRRMRNAAHENFRCRDTKSISSKWYNKDFIKGKSVSVLCKDMKRITEVLLEFFNCIEKSQPRTD